MKPATGRANHLITVATGNVTAARYLGIMLRVAGYALLVGVAATKQQSMRK